MGSRIPSAQDYSVRSAANSYDGSNLSDLNAIDGRHHPARTRNVDELSHEGLVEEQDDEDRHGRRHQLSSSVDRIHNTYRNSLPLHGVGAEEDCSALENNESPSAAFHILTVDDILPIETARARFLQIVVDYFISEHTIEVANSEVDYGGQDKLQKRNSSEVQYEGDPRFALPLMYVANVYETLVNDVNVRLAPFGGMREKTIGVALEAAGGLYRKLAQKFPKKGPCSFRRRELATSLETRTRFPELVVQDQKRVRFVVVNGLVIVEKPTTVPDEDAAWFKRLTGRHEMAVSDEDYKFYSPRHKYRRVGGSQPVSTLPGLSPHNEQPSASKQHIQPIQHQPHFDSVRHPHQQSMHPCQPASHYSHVNHFVPSQHMAEIPQPLQSPSMSHHIPCMQSLAGGQVGGRLHILPSPAKFCDGCGAPYLRDTSKFCSECGVKRLGT